MHRHGYQGRKLSREQGPRRALIRGLTTSLIIHERIQTTEAKAKEVAPRVERLVSYAKKGDLHNQRLLRSYLLTEKAAQKLIAELAPALKDRQGGYTRIIKSAPRRGDNARMATIMLVLPEKIAEARPEPSAKSETKQLESKPAAKTKPKAAREK